MLHSLLAAPASLTAKSLKPLQLARGARGSRTAVHVATAAAPEEAPAIGVICDLAAAQLELVGCIALRRLDDILQREVYAEAFEACVLQRLHVDGAATTMGEDLHTEAKMSGSCHTATRMQSLQQRQP